MTVTDERVVELTVKGKLETFKGKLDSLFNPALHPRGYHGRFTYTGGHELKRAEQAARKAERHQAHLDRLANRRSSGRGRRGRRGRRNINWPNNLPGGGGGLGRMLGKGGKGTKPPAGGAAGKGTQPKGAAQQPKGSQGSQPKGSSTGKGSQGKSGQGKGAASQVKAAQAAVTKARAAAQAQQIGQLKAALKQAQAAQKAAQAQATAAQKAQLAALVAQAKAMMAAAAPRKFTPSANAPLYGGRRAGAKQSSGNVGGPQLVLSTPTGGPVRGTSVALAAGSMAKASTPRRLGPNDLWWKPGFKLPDYIEHVASHLIASHGESKGIAMAVGIVRDWANGRPTGGMKKILPSTVAAARKAIAEWEALKARAKSVKSTRHFTADPTAALELARRPRRPRTEAPIEVITGRRYRRYRQQGYSAASALARVAREAQQRQAAQATELARQPGSVPVASANDGPRVTTASTSKGARVAGSTKSKSGRSWDTSANRKNWAKTGVALPDGSFPIPSAAFVGKAARALGRAPASKRARVKAHIRKRAKALGVTPPALGD